MNLIKTLLFFVLFWMQTTSSIGQLYLQTGVGFGFGLANSNLYENIRQEDDKITFISNKTSFGKGPALALHAGYATPGNVLFDLGFSYLFGKPELFTEYSNVNNLRESNSIEFKARMLRIIPSLGVKTGHENFNGYLRFGLSIGLIPTLEEIAQSEVESSGMVNSAYQKRLYSGGVSYGANGVIGISGKISHRLWFISELSCFAQSWAPRKSEITELRVNGMSMLHTLAICQIETEYVASFTYDGPVLSQPTKATQIRFPMSSIGLMIGISYNITSKKE
jgi:hypothetical protein